MLSICLEWQISMARWRFWGPRRSQNVPTRNGNWIGNWQFQKQMDAVFEDDEGEHAAFSSILQNLLVHVEAARGVGAMGLLPFGETRTGLYARPPRARRSLELGARVMKRRHNPDVRGMAGIRRDYTSNYWWNDFIVHPLVWDPVAGCTKHQEFREAFRMPRSMFKRLLRDLGTAKNLV